MKRKKQKRNRTTLIDPVFLLKYITVYDKIMIRKRGQNGTLWCSSKGN